MRSSPGKFRSFCSTSGGWNCTGARAVVLEVSAAGGDRSAPDDHAAVSECSAAAVSDSSVQVSRDSDVPQEAPEIGHEHAIVLLRAEHHRFIVAVNAQCLTEVFK